MTGSAEEDDAIEGDAIDELTALVERLDTDNERLRMRVLELMRLMEDAVTAQVAAERRITELEELLVEVRGELTAIESTRTMRIVRPLRDAYARARSSFGGSGSGVDG